MSGISGGIHDHLESSFVLSRVSTAYPFLCWNYDFY